MRPADIALQDSRFRRFLDNCSARPEPYCGDPVGRFANQLYPIFLRGTFAAARAQAGAQQSACDDGLPGEVRQTFHWALRCLTRILYQLPGQIGSRRKYTLAETLFLCKSRLFALKSTWANMNFPPGTYSLLPTQSRSPSKRFSRLNPALTTLS